MTIARIGLIEGCDPLIEGLCHQIRGHGHAVRAWSSSGSGIRGASDCRAVRQREPWRSAADPEGGALGNDAPDASGLAVAARIAQRVLGVALDRVVPIADIHRAARAVAKVDRNEAEVLGEDQIALILLVEVIVLLDPLVDLDAVGRLVAHLDEAALHLFGHMGKSTNS